MCQTCSVPVEVASNLMLPWENETDKASERMPEAEVLILRLEPPSAIDKRLRKGANTSGPIARLSWSAVHGVLGPVLIHDSSFRSGRFA
jgi:hypothetical protein